jgi:hypothetical protein
LFVLKGANLYKEKKNIFQAKKNNNHNLFM